MVISIILAAESFMVFVIAASFGLDAPSLKRFIGLCLGLARVVLIMVPGHEAGGVGGWVWMLIALGVPFCYAVADHGWPLFLIAAISTFSTILLIYAIRTTGAVFASQAGYAMTAAGIVRSVVVLDESDRSRARIYPSGRRRASSISITGIPSRMGKARPAGSLISSCAAAS